VYRGSRRVPGLFEHTDASGRTVYTARLRLRGKQQRVTLDANTKTDAIEELAALRVDGRRGDPIRSSSLVPEVDEVADQWLAALDLRVHHRDPGKRYSPRTVALYRDRLKRHVLPVLGTTPIDEVTVADLRRLVDRLGRKLAPGTVTQIIAMTSGLFRFAVRERMIERNPVRDLDRDDRPSAGRQTEPRYLAPDEVADLLARMSDTFRPVAATATFAGLRISEALGLTWADVDFAAKVIHVRRQLDPDGTIRDVTKTRSSTADVPLLPALDRELKAHRSRQAEVELRLVHASHLVFATRTGKPQGRRNALRAVQRAAEAVGLTGEGQQPVGLHDLRHSFVAIALDSGVTLVEAAVLARHANARVTGMVYAGISEQAKAKIAGKLTAAGYGV
jgi:integrase